MARILSKTRCMPGMPISSNNPDNATLIPVLKYLQISRQTWLLGVAFSLFTLIALITLRADSQHTHNHSVYREIIGDFSIHVQRLAIVSQETLWGNELAFAQLRESLDQLNHYSTTLQRGGRLSRAGNFSTAEAGSD